RREFSRLTGGRDQHAELLGGSGGALVQLRGLIELPADLDQLCLADQRLRLSEELRNSAKVTAVLALEVQRVGDDERLELARVRREDRPGEAGIRGHGAVALSGRPDRYAEYEDQEPTMPKQRPSYPHSSSPGRARAVNETFQETVSRTSAAGVKSVRNRGEEQCDEAPEHGFKRVAVAYDSGVPRRSRSCSPRREDPGRRHPTFHHASTGSAPLWQPTTRPKRTTRSKPRRTPTGEFSVARRRRG